MTSPSVSLTDRIAKYTTVDSDGDCWSWCGALTNGYAVLKYKGKNYRVSRLVLGGLELYDNPLDALHSCDNCICVNPAHLSWGSRQKNVKQSYERGRNPQQVSPEQVKEIRASATHYNVLCKQYGVTPQTIYRIQRGITHSTTAVD